MNQDEAIAILENIRPVTADSQQALLQFAEFCDTAEFFIKHPDTASIKPLLRAASTFRFMGVDLKVLDALQTQNTDAVREQLLLDLSSNDVYIRFFALLFARDFPSENMVPVLYRSLKEYSLTKGSDPDEEDERITILITLQRLAERIPGCGAGEAIQRALAADIELKRLFEATLRCENALLQMKITQCIKEAEEALMQKDYSRVVTILSPFEWSLQPLILKKLQIARKYMKL